MANQISKLITHIVSVFDVNPLVNTIVFRDDDVLDVEKENVYPMVVIQILPSVAPEQFVREFALGFEVLNQRDDIKTPVTGKLMLGTNYIDNVNICDSIANDFILEILKTHNDLDINIVEETISNFEPIRKDERNNLDGVKFQANFTMHQNAV